MFVVDITHTCAPRRFFFAACLPQLPALINYKKYSSAMLLIMYTRWYRTNFCRVKTRYYIVVQIPSPPHIHRDILDSIYLAYNKSRCFDRTIKQWPPYDYNQTKIKKQKKKKQNPTNFTFLLSSSSFIVDWVTKSETTNFHTKRRRNVKIMNLTITMTTTTMTMTIITFSIFQSAP